MKKEQLVSFIEKYNLKESVETVKIEVIDSTIETEFIDILRTLKGKVTFKDFDYDNLTFGVYDTKKLKTLLNVLNDEINIDFKMNGEDVDSLVFSDKTKEIRFIPCLLDIVPEVPPFKELPSEYALEIDVTDEFIESFVKSESAISESDFCDFIYDADNSQYEMVFGYSAEQDTNTIKISIDADVVQSDIFERLPFKSKYIREILLANKDMSKRSIKISSSGLMILEFDGDEFETKYYLKANV